MKEIKRIDDKTIEVDGKRYKMQEPDPQPPQSEFKVGQWLMIQHMGHICSIHTDGFKWDGFKTGQHPDETQPVRLIEKRKMNYPDMHIVEQSGNVFLFSCKEAFRLATPAEIEEHLKKEAEGRGYKPGVRFKSMNGDEIGRIRTIYANPFDYYASSDTLTVSTPRQEWRNLCSNPTIYEKGRWAEILPDKKKLPKTKEEFYLMIKEYYDCNNDLPFPQPIEEYLDNYED